VEEVIIGNFIGAAVAGMAEPMTEWLAEWKTATPFTMRKAKLKVCPTYR
jgi:hypothetical protein